MNYQNIGILSICLFISCAAQNAKKPQTINDQDIAYHAEFWADRYVPDLNDDEAALLINLFYFSNKYIDSQIKIGNAILFAYVHAGMINNLVVVNEEEAKKVALASAVALEKLKEEYLPERTAITQTLAHCTQAIEAAKAPSLKALINGFEDYGQAIITQFIHQDGPSIKRVIEEYNATFGQHLPLLNQNSASLQSIFQDKNSDLTENKEEDITQFNTAMLSAHNAIALLSDMLNKAIRIKRMSFDVLNIRKIMYQKFYQEILQKLQKEKRTPIFIMFNEQGIIAPENRQQDLVCF